MHPKAVGFDVRSAPQLHDGGAVSAAGLCHSMYERCPEVVVSRVELDAGLMNQQRVCLLLCAGLEEEVSGVLAVEFSEGHLSEMHVCEHPGRGDEAEAFTVGRVKREHEWEVVRLCISDKRFELAIVRILVLKVGL